MRLWDYIAGAHLRTAACLTDGENTIRLQEFTRASALGDALEALRGKSVLLASADAWTAALALIELDGVARRILVCPPDVKPAYLPQLARTAQIDAAVYSDGASAQPDLGLPCTVTVQRTLRALPARPQASHQSEWILMTSGTSGPPKLVVHSLASLTHAFAAEPQPPAEPQAPVEPQAPAEPPVWSTFYDIRRYGGLQILLRALVGGCTVLLSRPGQPVAGLVESAAAAGVTHISGTASHWRALLMSGSAARLAPRYVRLSGEIADQGILDALRAAYPRAQIAHAFASTEAGVGFEVGDGRAGFPADWVGQSAGNDRPATLRGGPQAGLHAELRVLDGSLALRSAGTAQRYLGDSARSLQDAEHFVDTGDRVTLRDGRYYFAGRAGGIINVAGLKVHPEEVEAVINALPGVRLSRVRARRNPITGAVVSAEVVLADAQSDSRIGEQILEACRRALPAHKVPAVIQIVPSLPLSPAGKLLRADGPDA